MEPKTPIRTVKNQLSFYVGATLALGYICGGLAGYLLLYDPFSAMLSFFVSYACIKLGVEHQLMWEKEFNDRHWWPF